MSGFHRLDQAGQESYGWYEVQVTDPPYNTDTEVREGPVDSFDPQTGTATRVYTVRSKTQQELDAEQEQADLSAVIAAGKDVVLIITELVPWLLANTAMTPDDFTPAVKQAYLDLKAIADRVRARL